MATARDNPQLEIEVIVKDDKYISGLKSLSQKTQRIRKEGQAREDASVAKIAAEGRAREDVKVRAADVKRGTDKKARTEKLESDLLAIRKKKLLGYQMADQRARQKMLAGHTTWSQKIVKNLSGIKKAMIGMAALYAVNLGRQALGGAIQAHADFSFQLARVRTLMPEATRQMGQYKEDIKDIATSGFNVKLDDITASYYETISASIPAAEATDFVRMSAKGATAGFATLQDAVKINTKLINAYGLSVKDTERIMDLLFTAQKFGVTTFGELAVSMGEIVDVASFLNVSIEDLAAGYIVMTKTVTTGVATTRMQAIMTAILKPTDEFIEKIGKTSESMRRIQDVGFIQFLQDIWVEVGKDADAIGELFGRKEAIAGFFALIAEDGQLAEDAVGNVTTALGLAREAYTSVEGEAQITLRTTGNRWGALLASIGRGFGFAWDVVTGEELRRNLNQALIENEAMLGRANAAMQGPPRFAPRTTDPRRPGFIGPRPFPALSPAIPVIRPSVTPDRPDSIPWILSEAARVAAQNQINLRTQSIRQAARLGVETTIIGEAQDRNNKLVEKYKETLRLE